MAPMKDNLLTQMKEVLGDVLKMWEASVYSSTLEKRVQQTLSLLKGKVVVDGEKLDADTFVREWLWKAVRETSCVPPELKRDMVKMLQAYIVYLQGGNQ